MLDSYFRPIYQPILVDPLSKLIKATSINIVSYLICLSAIMIHFAITHELHFTAILFVLAIAALDTIDDIVCASDPILNKQSKPLKTISYRLLEVAIIGSLYTLDPSQRALPALIMLGSAYLYFAVSTPGFGLIGKREALAFYIFMILDMRYFNMAAFIFSGVILVTTAQQLKKQWFFSAENVAGDIKLA